MQHIWLKITKVFKIDLHFYPAEWIISLPVNPQICSPVATFLDLLKIYS